MLTTKDILECHDEIHDVWRLGLQENALSKEAIIEADIKEITKDILNRRGGFVLRLSGVLLCGVTRLYSKKSIIFLADCQEAIAKISLKFLPLADNNDGNRKGKRSKKDKQSDQHVEIDEETMKLWQNEANLENIIEQEQRDESHKIQSKLVLINSPETNTSPNVHSQFQLENDFGNVPFEINVNQSNTNDPIEMTPDIPINEEESHFSENDNINDQEEDALPVVPFDMENEQKMNQKKKKFIIDITPIIPMTQLSALLENASETLCSRPMTKTNFRVMPMIMSREFDDLLNEVKKFAIQLPISKQIDNILTPPQTENEINEDFPETNAFPSDNEETYNDGFIEGIGNQADIEKEREYEAIKPIEIDLLAELNQSFQAYEEVPLLDIIPDNTRRSLALSFFTALSLKNRAIVDIVQTSKLSISLTKGKNY